MINLEFSSNVKDFHLLEQEFPFLVLCTTGKLMHICMRKNIPDSEQQKTTKMTISRTVGIYMVEYLIAGKMNELSHF